VTKRAATIVMVLLGTVMLVVICAVGLTAWLFMSVVDTADADGPTAAKAFEDVRDRFGKTEPVIELRNRDLVLKRKPPSNGAKPLNSLHVLAWDASDDRLTRVTLPFWFLRFKEEPIELSSEVMAGVRIEEPLSIDIKDIERYGPTLLLDEHRGNDRVLVWTD
jgi:hypothetical protein